MNKLRILITIALSGFITSNSFSQLSIDGEFRTRSFVEHGYKVPVLNGTNAEVAFDQRSRLIFNYKSKTLTSRLTLQDAHIWGSDDFVAKTGAYGNSSSLGIHESWVDLKLSDKSGLRIGRQEWSYDDLRILSWKNWWTTGLSYDGLLYHRQDTSKNSFLDLGISYNNDGNLLGPGGIDNNEWDMTKLKSISFVRTKKEFNKKFYATAFASLSTKVDTATNSELATATYGLHLNYNTGKKSNNGIFGFISSYYQHGSDISKGTSGGYKNIDAYLLNAELGLRTLDKKLETSIGAELISGKDYSKVGDDNTRYSFDMLYGSRFIYYGGAMNHFILQDSYLVGTKGGGYFDPYVKVKYKPNKKNIINLGAYFPQLTTNVTAHTGIDSKTKKPTGKEIDATGNTVYWKGELGTYLDLNYTHVFSKQVKLNVGMSYGIISDIKNQMVFGYKDVATKTLHNSNYNYFGWVMLIVKPNFFSNK